jgi:Kef-type K+ transport system membrane component KefB/mannitol/fructose-specific phosphotransferase system IIA component (Ntr-type)
MNHFLSNLQLPVQDPVLIFAIVMLIILMVPLLFNRIRIPGVVGLILAGTIVGPSVMGLLERDSTMILLGTVGLLYLMFMAGLSIDLNKFEKLRNRSIIFGLISFFIPQGMAVAAGLYLLDYSLFTSLLLGSIVGSHTLLAYPIANRIGIIKNTAITMTMGGTIVTDSLSLAVLAVVAGAVTGDVGPTFWITFISMVSVYVVIIVLGLPRLGRWFLRDSRNETNVEFVFLVALLFLTSYLAGLAGLAPIIGAFLAGLTLNRLVPESSPLMSRVQFVGNALFIPFFLISVGMLVDVGVLLEGFDVWILAGVFTGLVLIGKLMGAVFTGLIYRYSKEETMTVFGLSSPQAAATLAVTLVGYEIGLFDQMAVNAVVVLILITCMVGPWLVERFGRAVALQEEARPYNPSEAPQRILVPLANPATAESLMDIAMMMRGKNSDEPLFPITVARDGAKVDSQVAASEKMLSHAVVHAAAADIPVLPVTRVDMNISNGIMRAVKELRISDIVIGWNGQISTRQKIFGSILDKLLEQSDEMVLVSKIEHPVNTTKRVILATPPLIDREPGFDSAILTIQNLCDQIGAGILLVSTEMNSRRIKDILTKQEPKIDTEALLLSEWTEVVRTAGPRFSEDDLLIIMSTREGSLAWQNSLHRLPRIISKRYPKLNFITVYPSTSEKPADVEFKIHFEGSDIIPPIPRENIAMNQTGLTSKQLLIEMLASRFDGKSDERLSEIVSDVMKINPDNLPGELPGVVLTHYKTRFIKQPTLFLGISRDNIQFSNAEGSFNIIFLLLSSEETPEQRNLNILANLARLLGQTNTISRLKKATSLAEISGVISVANVSMDDEMA